MGGWAKANGHVESLSASGGKAMIWVEGLGLLQAESDSWENCRSPLGVSRGGAHLRGSCVFEFVLVSSMCGPYD